MIESDADWDPDWEGFEECDECQAVLDQFGRCNYCDRSWVWGNSGADPCRDVSAGVGIEDPGHIS